METKGRVEQLYSGKYKSSLKPYQKKSIAEYSPTKTNPVQVKSEAIRAIQPKGLQRQLFDYQSHDLGFIESRGGRCILGHEPGLGKTGMALAYLQLHPECRPAIIICPSSLKLNWTKEVFMWMEKRKENEVYILGGRSKKTCEEVSIKGSGRLILTPCKLPKTGIFIINYDVMPDWLDTLKTLKAEILLSDESQALKSKKALRTKAVLSLAKGIPKNIAMTGTLIENRPGEAYNVIHMIDPNLFPSEWKFKNRYCDPKFNGFGWDFNGSSHTDELHKKISNICIRRLKEDVLKDLPAKIRSVVPIDIDNRSEYRKAESDLIQWIRENKGLKKAEQASKVEALSRMNELKQLCIKGKLESCLNWIEDYLESGKKLVVFCTHTWVLDTVYEEFKDWSVKVDGSVTGVKRNDAVEAFQKNPKIKLFVGNIRAAGVGLTLTASSATCFLELDWTPAAHSQAEDRVHRIGQTAECVNAYYLLAANTVEEDIALLLDKKQKVVTAVLDGIEVVDMSLLDDLLDSISKGEE
jgi:SWI/SNF-related matrix-associated actin-dependent regulator 1 of chromatin subfamily A